MLLNIGLGLLNEVGSVFWGNVYYFIWIAFLIVENFLVSRVVLWIIFAFILQKSIILSSHVIIKIFECSTSFR